MWTVLSVLAAYGMGAGVALAVALKVIEYPDGFEFMIALAWPVCLPAMVAWWAVTSWIGGNDG